MRKKDRYKYSNKDTEEEVNEPRKSETKEKNYRKEEKIKK
jgi:hypothetical protein